jgi:hypothetical protein
MSDIVIEQTSTLPLERAEALREEIPQLAARRRKK